MSNLNTYALPQMKRILGDTGSSNDSVYLPFCQQAVYDVDNRLQSGMTVSISGNDYTVSPTPAATSNLWNIIARCAIWRYKAKLLNDYLEEMEGLASVRDEVTSFSRTAIVRAKVKEVEDARDEYEQELFSHTFGVSTTAIVAEELGLAEDTGETDE